MDKIWDENPYVIDNVQVFPLKCPLTTVRQLVSADKLQIARDEAEDTFVVCPNFHTPQYFHTPVSWLSS